jgi:hypothetical protein
VFQDGSLKTISSMPSHSRAAHSTARKTANLLPAPRVTTSHLACSVTDPQSPRPQIPRTIKRHPKTTPSFPDPYPAAPTDIDSARARRLAPRHQPKTPTNTGLYRFPFNNFTHCLTPFSRCFSSFPHGTCSLSVSCQYLALDEIYHPL